MLVKLALHEKSGNSAFYVCGTFSAYLCVLCVKYIGANVLTQSTQRYTEIRRETRTANEPTLRAKPGRNGRTGRNSFAQKVPNTTHGSGWMCSTATYMTRSYFKIPPTAVGGLFNLNVCSAPNMNYPPTPVGGISKSLDMSLVGRK